MIDFSKEQLTTEEAFWVMFYFLKEHYDLSEGTFDVSYILSASEPVEFNLMGRFDTKITGNRPIEAIDHCMISFWNDTIEKYKRDGKLPAKKFIK